MTLEKYYATPSKVPTILPEWTERFERTKKEVHEFLKQWSKKFASIHDANHGQTWINSALEMWRIWAGAELPVGETTSRWEYRWGSGWITRKDKVLSQEFDYNRKNLRHGKTLV